MTKNVFLLGLMFTQLSIFGQVADNTYKNNESNIYNQTFIQYFKYLDSKKMDLPDSIFVEHDFKLTDSLMTQIGKTKLIVLESSDLEKILQKTNNSLTVYRLFPMDLKNKEFCVSFVPFQVNYKQKEKEFNYINSGSIWVIFDYVNYKFRFKKINNNGI